MRTLEGLPPEKGVLRGEAARRRALLRGAGAAARPTCSTGQKTGAFLDQRENHVVAAQYAHGRGARLLLVRRRLRAPARHPRRAGHRGGDLRARRARSCARTPRRTGWTTSRSSTANAFDFLRDAVDEGKSFDTIVLDPPSFAKNKDAIEAALRGYKEINLRAMQLLRPGGVPDHRELHLPRRRRALRGDARLGRGRREATGPDRREAGRGQEITRCCSACARRATSSASCCG